MKEETLSNNQAAALSLTFGLATLLSFCGGLVPLPLTGFVCFPLGFVFSLLALIFGIVGLNQIRARNQTGAPMAWAGLLIGGIVFLCALCVVLSFASLLLIAPERVPSSLPTGLYQF